MDSQEDNNGSQLPGRIGGVNLTGVKKLSHTGIYSTVWRGNIDSKAGMQVVIKRHHIDPLQVDRELAEWQKYKRSIEALQEVTGITVPRQVAYEVKGEDIYFVDESAGSEDVSKLLSGVNASLEVKYRVIADLLRSLSSIPRDENNQTRFMIDGKLSNFCASKEGFVYVDTFPAHRRANNRTLLLYPSDDHISKKRNIVQDSFVTGDMCGILGRFLNQLCQKHPDLWKSINKNAVVRSTIEALPSDLREYVVNLINSDVAFIRQIPTMNVQDPKVIDDMLRLKKGMPV